MTIAVTGHRAHAHRAPSPRPTLLTALRRRHRDASIRRTEDLTTRIVAMMAQAPTGDARRDAKHAASLLRLQTRVDERRALVR